MLTWTSVVTHQTDTEIAAAVARREQLQIRPLIEHPALRRVMGLDAAEAAAAPVAIAGPPATKQATTKQVATNNAKRTNPAGTGRKRPSTSSSARSRKGASRRTAPSTGAPAKIAA